MLLITIDFLEDATTSAPSPKRAPSENRVLALWNTAALFVHKSKMHIFHNQVTTFINVVVRS